MIYNFMRDFVPQYRVLLDFDEVQDPLALLQLFVEDGQVKIIVGRSSVPCGNERCRCLG